MNLKRFHGIRGRNAGRLAGWLGGVPAAEPEACAGVMKSTEGLKD
jgi:hypothetical protein